jgi:acetyl-CoA C-acetyltransferase
MGQTAENVAALRGITRHEQDEFGVRSQNLAEKAIADDAAGRNGRVRR